MISLDDIRSLALQLPETSEEPHFDKTSFRVKKKIFATCQNNSDLLTLKLSEKDQDVFCAFDSNVIYPVPNKWGNQGWTMINLKTVPFEMFRDALIQAYCCVAPEKLAREVRASLG